MVVAESEATCQPVILRSAVQADAIPAVLSGSDIAIASETGSGKTLAYLLPIIHSLKQRQKDQQENRPDTAQCVLPHICKVCIIS